MFTIKPQANIIKKTYETQSYRTGSPVARKVKWLVIDAKTGRLIDVAKTRKAATDIARFAGYAV